MLNNHPKHNFPPYKSIAVALLFSVILGPIGLLYASFWGGVMMLLIGLVVLSSKLFFCILVYWVLCSVLSVYAAQRYNHLLFTAQIPK